MALTKSVVQVLASTSNAAGATTNSSWIDVSGAYEGTVYVKVTNAGTGPTVGMTVNIQRADDSSGTNTYNFASILHDIINNSVGYYPVTLWAGAQFLRVQGTGNTVQAVTIEARLDKTTAL